MQADLEEFKNILFNNHPLFDIDNNTAKMFFKLEINIFIRKKVLPHIKHALPKHIFKYLLQMVIANFEDSHSYISLEETETIPLYTKWTDEKLKVLISSQGLKKGDKILSIMGYKPDEIFKIITQLIPVETKDSQYTEGSRFILNRYFWTLMGLPSNASSIPISFKRGKQILRTKLIFKKEDNNYTQDFQNHSDYFSINKDHALLIVPSFNHPDFLAIIDMFFKKATQADVRTITLNLRYNRGGNYTYIDSLIAYISDLPYKIYQYLKRNKANTTELEFLSPTKQPKNIMQFTSYSTEINSKSFFLQFNSFQKNYLRILLEKASFSKRGIPIRKPSQIEVLKLFLKFIFRHPKSKFKYKEFVDTIIKITENIITKNKEEGRFTGKIRVLTNKHTYDAATMLYNILIANKLAISNNKEEEMPADNVETYTDNKDFLLSNSKVKFKVSSNLAFPPDTDFYADY